MRSPDVPVILLLALAVFISYANALTGDFQFDDYNVIVNEVQVHSWSAWYDHLGNGIRPLLKFSYTLNWTMGMGVAGFHLTNLLIHLANAWLVYRLAQEFVAGLGQREELRQVPLIAALLFAVHPVHTEAVSYICGRSASLMTLFYLAGLLAYVQGRARNDRVLLYFVPPLSFLLALAVKETAVTFPFALLLWEAYCGGRWRTALKAQWPSWAMLSIACIAFLFSDSYAAQMQRSAGLNSLQGNLATQLSAYAYLLGQWAMPWRLDIDPDLPLLNDLSQAAVPLALFAASLALALACWRRRPWLSFALAWAMLHLIPLYLLLPRLDVANERQLYIASWPLLLALTIEMTSWLGRRALYAAAALLLALTCLTLLRNEVYANEITLWEDTVQKSPGKARVHNNLGHAYRLAGRTEEARREFEVALRLDPQQAQARANLMRLERELSASRDRSASPASRP